MKIEKILANIKKITPFIVAIFLLFILVNKLSSIFSFSSVFIPYVLFIFSIPLWIEIVKSIWHGHFGVDLVAGLALSVAFIFGEYVPGLIVLLMLSGGEFLESYAQRRARKALSELLSLVPTRAHIKTPSGIRDIESKDVVVGTTIVVKAGEVIPVDGVVAFGESFVDESVMTGESMPVKKMIGNACFAGTTNSDSPIEITATKPLSESRLEGIIAMVRKAEEEKAPFVRMADKYSVSFTLLTLVMAILAWIFSHDPIRLLAVLVVATPCPLILATPIAFLSGMSASSRRGIIVKNGGALEAFSNVDIFVFDKTGTVTLGTPKVHKIEIYKDINKENVLILSASLDQLSVHPLAHSLVKYAEKEEAQLVYPESFKETFGDGVEGIIENKKYFFGKLSFVVNNGINVSNEIKEMHDKNRAGGITPVYLGSDSNLLGVVYFEDEIRGEASSLFVNIHNQGKQTMLLTGDKEEIAQHVAQTLSINSYKASCLPDDKLAVIKELQKDGKQVAMIGDGVNDAPALTQANVGIAIGSHGATAASDSADLVLLSSSISRVYDAWKISVHSVNVAKQGIFIGIGLSFVGMVFASFGYLPPFTGALIQEGIDIAVILYALRAGMVSNLLRENKNILS